MFLQKAINKCGAGAWRAPNCKSTPTLSAAIRWRINVLDQGFHNLYGWVGFHLIRSLNETIKCYHMKNRELKLYIERSSFIRQLNDFTDDMVIFEIASGTKSCTTIFVNLTICIVLEKSHSRNFRVNKKAKTPCLVSFIALLATYNDNCL